jgi:hypothetical protein
MELGATLTVKRAFADIAGTGSATVTVWTTMVAVRGTAKLAVTVPTVFMVQDGALTTPSVPVKLQEREVPLANPPPVTITLPSAVPNPMGAPVGDTAMVGVETMVSAPAKVSAGPLLGVMMMAYGPSTATLLIAN